MESEEDWSDNNRQPWIPIWCDFVQLTWPRLVISLNVSLGKLQRQVSTQFEIRRVEDSQNPTVSSGDASQLQVIIPRDLQAERHLHMYVSQGSG